MSAVDAAALPVWTWVHDYYLVDENQVHVARLDDPDRRHLLAAAPLVPALVAALRDTTCDTTALKIPCWCNRVGRSRCNEIRALLAHPALTKLRADPDYTTDTAHHPFVGTGTFCERPGCGETQSWHAALTRLGEHT